MVLRQSIEQKTVRTWAQTEALLDLHGMGHQSGIRGLQQAAAAPHQAFLGARGPQSTLETPSLQTIL